MGFFGNFILVRFFSFLFFSFFFFGGGGGGGGADATGNPRDLESFSLPHSHIPVSFSESAEPPPSDTFPVFLFSKTLTSRRPKPSVAGSGYLCMFCRD